MAAGCADGDAPSVRSGMQHCAMKPRVCRLADRVRDPMPESVAGADASVLSIRFRTFAVAFVSETSKSARRRSASWRSRLSCSRSCWSCASVCLASFRLALAPARDRRNSARASSASIVVLQAPQYRGSKGSTGSRLFGDCSWSARSIEKSRCCTALVSIVRTTSGSSMPRALAILWARLAISLAIRNRMLGLSSITMRL